MSHFTMTKSNYSTYYNVLEKMRDVFISLGYTVERFNENYPNGTTVQRGHRLHVKKGNVYIAMAGASNLNPTWTLGTDTWGTNQIKGIVVQIQTVSRAEDDRWWNSSTDNQLSTCQLGENSDCWFFVKDDSFLFCNRFTSTRYQFINLLKQKGFDTTKEYICMGTGTAGNPGTYTSAYGSSFSVFPFIFNGSYASANSSDATTYIYNSLNLDREIVVPNFGSTNSGASQSRTSLNYGRPGSATGIISKTKTPFSERFTPLPIHISTVVSAGPSSGLKKRFQLPNVYLILMDTYTPEETFLIGTDQFIALPFFEKSNTNLYTEVFCYNMGVAIKIGEGVNV